VPYPQPRRFLSPRTFPRDAEPKFSVAPLTPRFLEVPEDYYDSNKVRSISKNYSKKMIIQLNASLPSVIPENETCSSSSSSRNDTDRKNSETCCSDFEIAGSSSADYERGRSKVDTKPFAVTSSSSKTRLEILGECTKRIEVLVSGWL
jgi:hypothetical protein